MSRIRLVVCDLDGTLLNDKKMVSDYSAAVLQEVRNRGISICFASGRDEQMMSVYAKRIGGCDYMLSDNGAIVTDRMGNLIYSEMLEEKDAAAILGYLNKNKMTFMMYAHGKMYFSEGSEKLKKRIRDYELLSQKSGYPVKLKAEEFFRSASINGHNRAAKIVAYEEDPDTMQAFMDFIDLLPNVHCESTGYGLMGAFHYRVSKQTALQKVMEHLSVFSDEVCVFGDYDNDISMFACAQHRICMENGVAELKRAASHITGSNNDDGVAVYLANELGIYLDKKIYEQKNHKL